MFILNSGSQAVFSSWTQVLKHNRICQTNRSIINVYPQSPKYCITPSYNDVSYRLNTSDCLLNLRISFLQSPNNQSDGCDYMLQPSTSRPSFSLLLVFLSHPITALTAQSSKCICSAFSNFTPSSHTLLLAIIIPNRPCGAPTLKISISH